MILRNALSDELLGESTTNADYDNASQSQSVVRSGVPALTYGSIPQDGTRTSVMFTNRVRRSNSDSIGIDRSECK